MVCHRGERPSAFVEQAEIFDLALDLIAMRQSMEFIRTAVSSAKAVTPLEKSLVATRKPSFKKDPSSWVAPLLEDSVRMIAQWIFEYHSSEPVSPSLIYPSRGT